MKKTLRDDYYPLPLLCLLFRGYISSLVSSNFNGAEWKCLSIEEMMRFFLEWVWWKELSVIKKSLRFLYKREIVQKKVNLDSVIAKNYNRKKKKKDIKI